MPPSQEISTDSDVRDQLESAAATSDKGDRVPPKTIHQMRKSALRWAASVRALEACDSTEEAREFLEIEENGKERQIRERLRAKLEGAGRI